jgi:hypothetical protein
MITLTREEAKQVLDVLNDVRYRIEFGQMNLSDDTDAAIETLRARLAQPEPEPQEAIAKWIKTNTEHRQWYICPKCSYQAPRFKDEWQGLTDEEIDAAVKSCNTVDTYKYFRAIEAKLKEKNHD